MMYSELRRIQLEERGSNDLAEVEPDLYKKAYAYIKELRDSLLSQWDLNKAKELENIVKLLKDVETRRIEKLLKYAYNEVYNGFEPPRSLTEEERILYNNLKLNLSDFVGRLESYSRTEKKNTSESNDKNINESPQIKEDLIKVKVLKQIPPFKSLDGRVYGPFEEGVMVDLPEKEANILISRGVCEPVEV